MNVAYPAHREADVLLRDGSTVRVRPVREEDRPAIVRFLQGLSPESRWLRFFAGTVDFERLADVAVTVDYADRYGLVATVGLEPRVVGHGVYLSTAPGRAEVAFAIADDFQGRGLGTILLAHLVEVAREHGIELFEAQVLPQNHRMIGVFRESGFPVRMHSEPGVINVEFPVQMTPDALVRFEERERVAAAAGIHRFLSPRSVAVVGASRRRGTIAGEVFHNLVAGGFNGPVYPVNPKAEVVQSVRAYPTVQQIPGPVDLAVIVVPAESVVKVARDCGEAGVGALVVISAGFAETGEAGTTRQRQLVQVCREAGMRLIGPNCMGVINTSPDVSLNATFAPSFPPPGRVGFLSQSGALGLAVIDHAEAMGLGISSFVSVGNKADVSGNDLLQYWEQDEDTDAMLLYLESFGNPRKFARIARRIADRKPIVAVKSGRSAAGARATTSHTGALIAASDVTVDALFEQAGVIRTDTLAELFDVASVLASQPVPRERRVGIVTNAGGPGIMCADTCEASGLQVTELSAGVRDELSRFLPAEASTTNPVDMIASASAEDYGRAIRLLGSSGEVDALIAIFIPPLVTRSEDVAEALREAAADVPEGIPLLAVFMQSRGVPTALREGQERIPSFTFPENAARALARAANLGSWRAQPEGTVPSFSDVRREEAAAVVASALARGPGWIPPDEATRLLACYGIPLAESQLAATPEEAGRAAAGLGGPVALKAVAPTLVHKTEARAVRLGLEGESTVTEAAEQMAREVASAGHRVERFLVQRMVGDGVEMLVGVVHDPTFGPVVACGAGGTAVELLKDVAVRITPLTDLDAAAMVRSLSTFPLLDGYRGAARADVASLEELLLRVAAMVEDLPAIAEMDCNPVMVTPTGSVVVDARVRLEVPAPSAPIGARR